MKFFALAAGLSTIFAEQNIATVIDGVDVSAMANLFDAVNSMDLNFNTHFVDAMEAPPSFLDSDKVSRKCAAIRAEADCTGSCSWCKAIKPGGEPTGCRDKLASRRLQASGSYFCAIEGDVAFDICNGSNPNVCSLTPACIWCEHKSMGKGCFSLKQAHLMPFHEIACKNNDIPELD